LHVHERIDPDTIIDAVRKRNGNTLPVQPSLFERREENPPLREAIDFYRSGSIADPFEQAWTIATHKEDL